MPAAATAIEPPLIEDREASTDAACFSEHPRRHYRSRAGWLVRRKGVVFLRTPDSADPTDSEAEAEGRWWTAAWPQLSAKARRELIKVSRG
jgi:hypothetical protein